MARNKPKSLPKFESLDKLVEFFDANDMGDYWEQLPEVPLAAPLMPSVRRLAETAVSFHQKVNYGARKKA